jgi:hypothetical protein
MNLNNSQFFKLGGARQQRKKFGGSEGTFNPIDAFKSLINTGPAYELSLKNKAKETMLFGAVNNAVEANRSQMKKQGTADAIFGFHDTFAEKFPEAPMPQKVNLDLGTWEYPKKAGKEIAEIYRDRRIKDLQDRLAKYEKTPEDNEGKDPEPPTPGSK